MRTCHICGTETDTWCPTCVANFPQRRPAGEMTGDERAAELHSLAEVAEIPFDMMHQRIEELVGRPVWTHELAGWDRFKMLIEEARTGQHASFEEVLDKLPEGKPVIVLVADE